MITESVLNHSVELNGFDAWIVMQLYTVRAKIRHNTQNLLSIKILQVMLEHAR